MMATIKVRDPSNGQFVELPFSNGYTPVKGVDYFTPQEIQDIERQVSENGTIRPCKIVVGTSTSGWSSLNCNYLCDGTGDDVEINQAINALSSSGGQIIFLDGTYNLTNTINISNKDNIRLCGNHGVVFKMVSHTEDMPGGDSSTTVPDYISVSSSNNVEIDNINFDNFDNSEILDSVNTSGVHANSSNNLRVTNCTFNFLYYGINTNVCHESVISYNYFDQNYQDIRFIQSQDSMIVNNRSTDCITYNIACDRTRNLLISENLFTGGNTSNVDIDNSTDMSNYINNTVVNNILRSFSGDYSSQQARINIVSNYSIVANNIVTGHTHGILSQGNYNSIHHNIIQECEKSPLQVTNSQFNLIDNNIIRSDPLTAGIRVIGDYSSINNTVSNNIFPLPYVDVAQYNPNGKNTFINNQYPDVNGFVEISQGVQIGDIQILYSNGSLKFNDTSST